MLILFYYSVTFVVLLAILLKNKYTEYYTAIQKIK